MGKKASYLRLDFVADLGEAAVPDSSTGLFVTYVLEVSLRYSGMRNSLGARHCSSDDANFGEVSTLSAMIPGSCGNLS